MSGLLLLLITLLYPLAIWLGGEVEPRFLAGLLLLAGLTRFLTLKGNPAELWWLGGAALLLIAAVWSNLLLPLKLYPVLVNGVLLGVFAYSLFFPPSMIERFARMSEPDLPAHAIGYTRRVTQIWCLFFAINGAIALMTALWASPATWTLYNGLIAYLAMGLLFAGEYVVRWHFKRQLHV
ncbi:MAG TPA: hypothetical protein VEG60_28015 [Candidatus Binatia bacterium]|nr:hypothetical protein [Candidatus Binatia bacterium]